MSLRTKIIAFQLFLIGVALVLAGVVYFAIMRADDYIARVSITHRQLETITALSLHANRYSEQIAEMLLFGESGLREFEDARADLESSFQALEKVTSAEIAFVTDVVERRNEQRELALIADMRAITARMHATALLLLEFVVAGREDLARGRYFAEIEEGLDDRLQQLIDLAIADEQAEVRQVDSETETLAQELVVVVVVTTLLAIVASSGAVLLLSRALSRPIARLTEGAGAIGEGRLGHRIQVEGQDELALLSQHFNQMAEQVETQRQALLVHQTVLEQKVSERTRQLEEANRRLEDLDRLRVLFLADVSHELRTPLAVVRGEAEVTLRSRSSSADDCCDTLGRIVEQAEHMTRLVDDLLFVTRAEADSIRFEMRRIGLRAVLEKAIVDGRALAASHNVDIRASLPAAPLHVVGDGQRLHQTALIAIDNAIKYAHTERAIEIELQAIDGRAHILVRNRGPGIPSEDLPYIFDRFYRSRPNGQTGGSGLGLSIAKWIVEKHNGTIELSSVPGEVTELDIRLPLA